MLRRRIYGIGTLDVFLILANGPVSAIISTYTLAKYDNGPHMAMVGAMPMAYCAVVVGMAKKWRMSW